MPLLDIVLGIESFNPLITLLNRVHVYPYVDVTSNALLASCIFVCVCVSAARAPTWSAAASETESRMAVLIPNFYVPFFPRCCLFVASEFLRQMCRSGRKASQLLLEVAHTRNDFYVELGGIRLQKVNVNTGWRWGAPPGARYSYFATARRASQGTSTSPLRRRAFPSQGQRTGAEGRVGRSFLPCGARIKRSK